MTCQECEKQFSRDYNYCPFCGATKEEVHAETMEKERSDRRRLAELAIAERVFKRVLWWISILVSIVVVAGTLVGWNLNGVRQRAIEEVQTELGKTLKVLSEAQQQTEPVIDSAKSMQKDLEDARRSVAEVRKLRTDLNALQSQVEGFYKTMIRESFGGKRNATNYSGEMGKWVLRLQRAPLKTSVRVLCNGVQQYPESYKIEGNTLTSYCPVDLRLNAPEGFEQLIIVEYHPAR